MDSKPKKNMENHSVVGECVCQWLKMTEHTNKHSLYVFSLSHTLHSSLCLSLFVDIYGLGNFMAFKHKNQLKIYLTDIIVIQWNIIMNGRILNAQNEIRLRQPDLCVCIKFALSTGIFTMPFNVRRFSGRHQNTTGFHHRICGFVQSMGWLVQPTSSPKTSSYFPWHWLWLTSHAHDKRQTNRPEFRKWAFFPLDLHINAKITVNRCEPPSAI